MFNVAMTNDWFYSFVMSHDNGGRKGGSRDAVAPFVLCIPCWKYR